MEDPVLCREFDVAEAEGSRPVRRKIEADGQRCCELQVGGRAVVEVDAARSRKITL